MMKNLRIALVAAALCVLAALSFTACDLFGSDATISFSLTDAPIDPSLVKSVMLTVSGVSVNEKGTASESDSSWITSLIEPPLVVDVLDLQNGVTAALGEVVIKGGTQVNQIRLTVDSVMVVETDDSEHVATLQSATGFKIVNAFQVPRSGNLALTIDFDVRHSLIEVDGSYFLKPALRAVVDGEAGKITGSVSDTGAIVVYAYADGTFVPGEAMADAEGVTFSGAYASTLAKADGSYVLAFMDADTYDLVAVDASGAVVGELADVLVESGATTAGQNF